MSEKKCSAGLIWCVIKGAVSEWMDANAMRLSAALSYYSVFSIAPLLLIAIGIAGWFYGGPAAAEGKIEAHLTGLIGWEAAKAVQAMVKSAGEHGSGGATVIGFITLLVGASTVFGQLKDSLNTIWEVRPKAGLGVWAFVKNYLLTFGMVLAIGFLLLVSLIVAAVVAGLGDWMQANLGLPKAVSGLLGFVVPLLVEAALFAMLFKVLPDAEIEWRSVWVGGALTAVLFELGKWGLSFYLTKAAPQSSFGAMGSLVIVLLWTYYASTILFFGAAVTEVYARQMGHSIQPAANAESTKLTCPGGGQPQPVSGGRAAEVEEIPAEVALARDGATPPRAPMHESLTPLIARTLQPDPETARRAAEEAALAGTLSGRLQLLVKRANEHPVVEVVAALGVGVLAGTIQRFAEKEEELSPSEHFRLGAKELGERGQGWAARMLEQAQGKLAKVRA